LLQKTNVGAWPRNVPKPADCKAIWRAKS
jgi:hypothetical protein